MKERLRAAQSLSIALSCCALMLAGAALYRGYKHYQHASDEMDTALLPLTPNSNKNTPFGHPYYRYSVVPGGLHSRDDLRRALNNDDVVRAHYAGFNAENARVVILEKARLAFVSYRVGDRIFWTHRPVHLAKGEKFLSDGVHLIRARCGNRIADEPPAPNAAAEPEESFMDAPVLIAMGTPPPTSVASLDVPPDIPIELAVMPGIPKYLAPLADGILPISDPLNDYVPTEGENTEMANYLHHEVMVIVPRAYTGLDQISNPPPPVSAVVEPASFMLILLSLSGWLLAWRYRTK